MSFYLIRPNNIERDTEIFDFSNREELENFLIEQLDLDHKENFGAWTLIEGEEIDFTARIEMNYFIDTEN